MPLSTHAGATTISLLAFLGNAAGNFLYQIVARVPDYSSALDRTYWEFVLLVSIVLSDKLLWRVRK